MAGVMPDAMAPSREEWEWGLAVVWSRSFGMPLASGGGTAPVLAPVTGMFNGAAYPARLVQVRVRVGVRVRVRARVRVGVRVRVLRVRRLALANPNPNPNPKLTSET